MAEYVDRDLLSKVLHEADEITFDGLDIIDHFPTADVQPVVRCNECKLYDGAHNVRGVGLCIYWMHMTLWDDYCSHGMREDGET